MQLCIQVMLLYSAFYTALLSSMKYEFWLQTSRAQLLQAQSVQVIRKRLVRCLQDAYTNSLVM